MKKFFIVTTIIFFGATVFFGYHYLKGLETGIDTSTVGNPTCVNSICKDYSDAESYGRVNGFMADKLFNNYGTDDGKIFIWNGGTTNRIDDSRSAWFPLDRIKQYIWEIEMQSCKNDCHDNLGLRVYYGKYPDSTSSLWPLFAASGVPTRFSNHHTLFIVPTYHVRGANIDFDPWAGCRQPIRTDSSALSTIPHAIFLFGSDGSGDAQNHGSLIPPDDARGSIGGGD